MTEPVVEYIDWGGRIKVTWLPGANLPPAELITSVHACCFHESRVMLVDLNHRGWDMPGGHREPGETAEACLLRECLEEGYVRGRATLLGLVEVDHSENASWQPGGKYPRVGYQACYRLDVTELLPFEAQFESARRIFVEPEQVPALHHHWNRMLSLALEAALRA